MKENAKSKLGDLTGYVIFAVIIFIVGGIFFLQSSNRGLAKSVADKYRPSVEVVDKLERSGCRDIPDGWLSEYGEENKSDAILYCQDKLANGGSDKLKETIIDSAKQEYFKELKKKGGVYEVANTVACFVLYCPVQDINELKK